MKMKRLKATVPRWLPIPALSLVLLVSVTMPARSGAETPDSGEAACALCPKEVSFRFLYGETDKASLHFYTFGPRVAFDLPRIVPPIAGNRLRLVIELLGSTIHDGGREHEVAFSPLIFDYRYDVGFPVVPFLEGGEGILYTSLSGLRLGGHFQFSSQAGGGIHLFLTPKDALTIGARIRHISNAGIRSENSGLNTYFLVFAWSHFPFRQ